MGALRVSSHLVVLRDGSVTQYVKFTERAWHAGKSIYRGREACNDFSVGVELEGTDTLPYEAAQYDALAEVVAALCAAYPRLSPRTASSATAISLPAARPIPDRPSTGRAPARLIAAASPTSLRPRTANP